MSGSIIVTSIILIIFIISLMNFRLSLCDSNTRITFICWNLILILIIIDLYIIGSKNITQVTEEINETIVKTKSSSLGIIITVIVIIIVLKQVLFDTFEI